MGGKKEPMYKKDTQNWIKHLDFILLDLICLLLSYVLAGLIVDGEIYPAAIAAYSNMAFTLELIDLTVMFALDTLKDVLKAGHFQNLIITTRHALTLTAAAILYLFVIEGGQQSMVKLFLVTMLLYIVITYCVRELAKQYLRKRMAEDGDRSLLIVTTAGMAEEALENVREHNYRRYRIAGLAIIDTDLTGSRFSGVKVVATAETAPTYVCQEWIDEVLIVTAEGAVEQQKALRLLNQLTETGVTVHFNLKKLSNVPGTQQFVEEICNYPVITTTLNSASSRQLLMKRLLDIAAGLVGCTLTGILFLFIAPAIYHSSPGPIFFSQERVGLNGKKFKMYKFRSMYLDAEARKAELMKDNKLGDGKMFKLDFDPRVIGNRILPDGTRKTGIGDLIRRTSLDEFPQFFNVLKGDMSVVGTRPPLVGEVSLYELHHRTRLSIKPGITGMWQVSGRSDITDFEEVVRLDREYISKWSIWLDLKILFKTMIVVFRKDGSM